jgi:hypothetical protein
MASKKKEVEVPDPATAVSITAVKDGIEVLEKLGVLERLRLKLVNDPDQAARHLSVALAELVSGYTALHSEIVAFGLLSVDEPGLDAKTKLTRLSDGHLAAELHAVKGSCARIWNIYERYLKGWFSHALNKNEARELRAVFVHLSNMDGEFVRAAEQLSELAARFAKEILTLLRKKRAKEATEKMRELEQALEPLREELSAKMAGLWDLQAKFIKLARTV